MRFFVLPASLWLLAVPACMSPGYRISERDQTEEVHAAAEPGVLSEGGGAGEPAAGAAGATAAGAGGAGSAGEEACVRSAPILEGRVKNARDMGGIPLESGGSVACGALLRGSPLASLSPAACDEVAALGIRTLIDLRTESERAGSPDADCVAARRVLAPLPIPYDVSPRAYLEDLNTADSMAAVFQQLIEPDAYPVYFHCTFGRDRTGVVGAVVLLALGASRADVMQEYLLSQSSVGAYPDSLDAVLDELEARGGVESFLGELGIGAAELAALRANLVEAP